MDTVKINGVTDHLLRYFVVEMRLKRSKKEFEAENLDEKTYEALGNLILDLEDNAVDLLKAHHDLVDKYNNEQVNDEDLEKALSKKRYTMNLRLEAASSVIPIEEINNPTYLWHRSFNYAKNKDKRRKEDPNFIKEYHYKDMITLYQNGYLLVVYDYKMQHLDDEYVEHARAENLLNPLDKVQEQKIKDLKSRLEDKSSSGGIGIRWIALISHINVELRLLSEIKNVVCVVRNLQRVWGHLHRDNNNQLKLRLGNSELIDIEPEEVHIYPVINQYHVRELLDQNLHFKSICCVSFEKAPIENTAPSKALFIKELQALAEQPTQDTGAEENKVTCGTVTLITTKPVVSAQPRRVLYRSSIYDQAKRQRVSLSGKDSKSTAPPRVTAGR